MANRHLLASLSELDYQFPLTCLDMGGIEPALVPTKSCQFEGLRRHICDPRVNPDLEPPNCSPPFWVSHLQSEIMSIYLEGLTAG